MKLLLDKTCVYPIGVTPLVAYWLIMRWSLYYREIHEDEKVEQALTDGKQRPQAKSIDSSLPLVNLLT